MNLSAWSIADRINAALLGAAVVGIVLTWWQARSGARTQRAAFLRDLYATVNTDPGISEAFYQIEYEQFAYDADFHGSDLEKHVDRLLSFLDLVCELYFRGVLKKREMQFFEYRFRRIVGSKSVQEYLSFLRKFYLLNSTRSEPFPSFARYSRELSGETEGGLRRIIRSRMTWLRGRRIEPEHLAKSQ